MASPLVTSTEQLFRLMVEEARDIAIFLLDPGGHIITWNEGAKRIFGWSEDEVLHRHFRMLFTPDDRERGVPDRELATARDTGQGFETGWRLRNDGRVFFSDSVLTSLRDEAGEVVGFSKIARDVTERYIAQRRLAAQLALTRLTGVDEPLGAVACRIMEAICENLGWDIGAMWRVDGDVLHSIDTWVGEDLPRSIARAVTASGTMRRGEGLPGRVLAEGHPLQVSAEEIDRTFPRADELFRLGVRSALAFPIVHNRTTMAVMEFFSRNSYYHEEQLLPTMSVIGAQIGDYLELLRTSEALRASERELERLLANEQAARAEAEAARAQLERRTEEEVSFRELASALSGAVEMEDVLHEITSRATFVTRADGVYVERIVGNNREVEVVSAFGRGTPPRGLRIPYPGSLTEEILRGRTPVILADMKTVGRGMAPYLVDRCPDCELLITPLIADQEALGSLVLLNSHMSGRHFNQNDLGRARTLGDLASLALRRVRLHEEEREAKEKAEAAVRVRDETLGIVSHDLRNPLTTIALSAELLPEATDEERREHIETIRTAAQSMQRLIQDLLDVARVEAGRLSVQKLMIDPAEIARRACDSHAPLAERRNVRLDCDIPDLPRICGDRERLLQVFGNLIGNALKFTPSGGCITVRGSQDDKSVIFEVQDTGPGIPDSDLRNVFKPYWQAKKTAHMGAGLGLAIVRGIIDAHGGTVSAKNAPGGGALFTFTLPK